VDTKNVVTNFSPTRHPRQFKNRTRYAEVGFSLKNLMPTPPVDIQRIPIKVIFSQNLLQRPKRRMNTDNSSKNEKLEKQTTRDVDRVADVYIEHLSRKELQSYDPRQTLFRTKYHSQPLKLDSKFSQLVTELVKNSEHHGRIHEIFNTREDRRFNQYEAAQLVHDIYEHQIITRYGWDAEECFDKAQQHCNPINIDLRSNLDQLIPPTTGDKLIREHVEREIRTQYSFWCDGRGAFTWALGVLSYFLVCGPPTSECVPELTRMYRLMKLGPVALSTKNYDGWSKLSATTQKFILKLLHNHNEDFPTTSGISEDCFFHQYITLAMFGTEDEYEPELEPEIDVENRRESDNMLPNANATVDEPDVGQHEKENRRDWTEAHESADARVGLNGRSDEAGRTVAKGMDVASFKTALQLHKEEMRQLRDERAQTPNPDREESKREWASFFVATTKLSKKKKRKINAAKRSEKAERKRKQKEWEELNTWKPNKLDIQVCEDLHKLDRENEELVETIRKDRYEREYRDVFDT
jgi:hypothetical protein